LEGWVKPMSFNSHYFLNSTNSIGDIRYEGWDGGVAPRTNSIQWSIPLLNRCFFNNSKSITYSYCPGTYAVALDTSPLRSNLLFIILVRKTSSHLLIALLIEMVENHVLSFINVVNHKKLKIRTYLISNHDTVKVW